MTTPVHENVQKYYGACLVTSDDLKTSASCKLPSRPMPRSVLEALNAVHPDVCKKYFGCGLVLPDKLQGCKILDLGSGSGRDCYILSKLVGKTGFVTGIDMTEEMISVSQKYIQYHQAKFGYEKSNTVFVQGYMENLSETGIENESLDVVVSNCVICLCADKTAVLEETHRVLKEGGEFYFSDMYSSKAIPEHLKQDPVLWGEGMGGSLYWQDLVSLVRQIGFSGPHLVSASHITVHDSELLRKAGDITYASGTYRMFKLPTKFVKVDATVTYKGTVPECPEQLEFDALHTFQTNVPVRVDAEMAAVLRHSRFAPDFSIQNSVCPTPSQDYISQCCHSNPFLLADKLGSSTKQCSKGGRRSNGDKQTSSSLS